MKLYHDNWVDLMIKALTLIEDTGANYAKINCRPCGWSEGEVDFYFLWKASESRFIRIVYNDPDTGSEKWINL